MVNPFGESSGSKYEWMAKYESEKNRADALQYRVNELQAVIKDYEEAVNKLLKTKEELETDNAYMRQMLNESDIRSQPQNPFVTTPQDNSLREENVSLRSQIDELKSHINRAQTSQAETVYAVPKLLDEAIIPMLLNHFSPTDSSFTSGFKDFVEAVIQVGNIEQRIVANLIKHGGSGPLDKLKQVVGTSEFDYTLDMLKRKNILSESQGIVYLATSDFTAENLSSNWADMDIPEMFETLETMLGSANDLELQHAFEGFRDNLQGRDIPATTIFFAIRKAIEGVQKGTMSRKELSDEVANWKSKLM